MAELDEAIEAAMVVMYGDHPHAENYRAHVQLGVTAAAELIVAATRRQVADELRAEGERLNGADWQIHAIGYAHAARWLTDRNAAIARGRGETQQPPTH